MPGGVPTICRWLASLSWRCCRSPAALDLWLWLGRYMKQMKAQYSPSMVELLQSMGFNSMNEFSESEPSEIGDAAQVSEDFSEIEEAALNEVSEIGEVEGRCMMHICLITLTEKFRCILRGSTSFCQFLVLEISRWNPSCAGRW